MIRIILTMVLFTPLANANDAFFQGAGSTFYPIENKNLRVIGEDLRISYMEQENCYELHDNAKRVACQGGGDQMVTRWKVQADYQVEALADQRNVQMGFPVPLWSHEFINEKHDLDSEAVDGATAFRTFIDDKEIKEVAPKDLALLEDTLYHRQQGERPVYGGSSGFVWKASFEKGRRYALRTTYEFGPAHSAGFYEGREYIPGEEPWFMPSWNHIRNGSAATVTYFLTPLKYWEATPPKSIRIRLDLPSGMPAFYVVPIYPKPSCVEEGAVYYELENMFPEHDFEVSMPESRFGALAPMKTAEEWDKWMSVMAPKARISCALRRNIQKGADTDLQKKLDLLSCVESCSARG